MVSSRLILFHLTPCPTLNWSRMWRSTAKDMPRSSWMWVISEPGAGHSKNRDFTCIKWGVHPARMVINHDSPSKSGTSENIWELMVAFCGWLYLHAVLQGFGWIFYDFLTSNFSWRRSHTNNCWEPFSHPSAILAQCSILCVQQLPQ